MANNKIIHNAVRMADDEVYGPGREDELEKVLSKDQLKRLTDDGSITGFGQSPSAAVAEKVEPKKGK